MDVSKASVVAGELACRLTESGTAEHLRYASAIRVLVDAAAGHKNAHKRVAGISKVSRNKVLFALENLRRTGMAEVSLATLCREAKASKSIMYRWGQLLPLPKPRLIHRADYGQDGPRVFKVAELFSWVSRLPVNKGGGRRDIGERTSD